MPSFESRTTSYLLRRFVKSSSSHHSSVKSVRLAVNAFTRITPRQGDVRIQTSPSARLPGDWIQPAGGGGGRLIFYIHGGGYFFGSPQTHRPLTTRLAKLADARLFALRYRLAPEHRFPAPLSDAVSAYRELMELGYDPGRIVMAGDSAGGGLMLATLTALRDEGIPLPAGAICLSPWTDLALTGESIVSNAKTCAMFRAESLEKASQQYLLEQSPFHPLASPLYAKLHNLPPLLVHVSDSEILLNDSTRLAHLATKAGVDVQLKIYRDQPHVWQIFPYLREAQDSLKRAAAVIQEWIPSGMSKGPSLCSIGETA